MLKVLSTSLIAIAGLASVTAHSEVVNGGAVHFVGEVTSAACAVDAGSLDQTVQLGQVRAAQLATAGATSSNVGFNIQLNDCDTTVSQTAAVAFLGSVVTGTTNTLALQSSAAGSATNVGVQILDASGSILNLDGASFSTAVTLSNGTNAIPFQARYIATGAATPGTANADATFKVQYL